MLPTCSIKKIASLLFYELVKNGRLGACIDISDIFTAICEREGIWSCRIGGSLTIEFPANSRLSTLYFYSLDSGSFVAGHAWAFAPPYSVVDISIRQQPNISLEKANLLPTVVLSLGTNKLESPINGIYKDIMSSEFIGQLGPRCFPEQYIQMFCPNIPDIFCAFPVILEQEQHGTTLKYIPVQPGCPEGHFETYKTMDFAGMTPYELYLKKLRSLINNET